MIRLTDNIAVLTVTGIPRFDISHLRRPIVEFLGACIALDFRSFEGSGLLLTRGPFAGPGPAGRG